MKMGKINPYDVRESAIYLIHEVINANIDNDKDFDLVFSELNRIAVVHGSEAWRKAVLDILNRGVHDTASELKQRE